ncbi:MAG: DinB family protein [Dehalococcoidia bacterium]
MTQIHAAAKNVLNASLDQLREAVERFPDEATDWNPLPEGNPVGVLVAHALAATDFWIGQASGRPMTFAQYRAERRSPAFATNNQPTAQLLAMIEATRSELGGRLEQATAADLVVEVVQPEDGAVYGGEECLLRGLAHLREHVGHTETMSDFWRAGIGR